MDDEVELDDLDELDGWLELLDEHALAHITAVRPTATALIFMASPDNAFNKVGSYTTLCTKLGMEYSKAVSHRWDVSRSSSVPLDAEAVEHERRELGLCIREHRLLAELSQEALAERAGVERKLVSRAETGTHAITLDALIRLAHGLGLSESELLR